MGHQIAFVGRGAGGPPVLLVHGYPLDHGMWRGQIRGLSDAARVVALDLPGFGDTPAASDGTRPTTMDEYADHVLALADALGFARFVLGGLSMGGYVALALARRRPERLAGLILCDTRAEPDAEAARKARLDTAQAALATGLSALVAELPRKLLAPETLAHRQRVVSAVESMIWRASWAGVAAALRGMAERRDARPDLPALRVPTLVVVGEEDALTPPATARELAGAIADAELEVIMGAGHLAPLEQPDAVNAAIRTFLERVGAAG